MAIVRFTLDPNNRPKLTDAQRARLDAMTDEEITAAALSDPDNPPFTEEELQILDDVNFLRGVRDATGLSQAKFAEAYRINLALHTGTLIGLPGRVLLALASLFLLVLAVSGALIWLRKRPFKRAVPNPAVIRENEFAGKY